MGKPTGFMEIARQTSTELPPKNAFRTLTNFTSRCRRMNSRREGRPMHGIGGPLPFSPRSGMMIGGQSDKAGLGPVYGNLTLTTPEVRKPYRSVPTEGP